MTKMRADYKLNIQDFINEVDDLRKRYPKVTKRGLAKVGREVKDELAAASPYGGYRREKKSTGKAINLKDRWHSKTEEDLSGEFKSLVWTDAPHFHLINRGHKIVTKWGQVKGFKAGTHYLEKALDDYRDTKLEARLEEMAESLIHKKGIEDRKAARAARAAAKKGKRK